MQLITALPSTNIAADVNLNSGWNDFISVFDPSGGVRAVAAIIGVAIMILFFVKWLWDKRRGGGGGFPVMALVLGAILAAPGALIPIVLTLIGWIVGLIATIVEALANKGGA